MRKYRPTDKLTVGTPDTRPLPPRFGIEQTEEWTEARKKLEHARKAGSDIDDTERLIAAMIHAAKLPEQSHHGRRGDK